MSRRNHDELIEVFSDDDDSVDDSDDEAEDAADRAQLKALEARIAERKAKRARKRRKTDDFEFRFWLPQSKLDKLDQIEKPADKRLQQLLWELKCDFTLFEHQYVGVRVLAGVSADFPGEEMLLVERENKKTKARQLALRNAKPRREQDDHGVLCADAMGLGKTVEAVAALVLRNSIASAKGEPRKPSIVSCPNDGVLNQWRQHLLQGGLKWRQIVRLKPRLSEPLDKTDAVFLCTKYDLQGAAKHIFEALPPPKKKDQPVEMVAMHKPSPLFPNASEELLRVLDNQYKHTNNKGAKNKYNKAYLGRDRTLNTDLPWICAYLEIDPDGIADGHGGEAVLHNGQVVGSTASVAYGPTVGKILAFAYIKPSAAQPGTPLEVIIHGQPRSARVLGEPAYDPQSLKPRTDA